MPNVPVVPLPAAFLRAPIAHRALHDRASGRIENSLSAVRAAVAAGYGIEVDTQPSSDNVPMIFHDHDLPRVTGRQGNVHDVTAAELGRIPLLDTSDTIPTLAAVLDAIDGRVPLLLEIKDLDGSRRPIGAFEREVAKVLAKAKGPVAVMSFNPDSVAAMAEAAPHLPRGITTSGFKPEEWPAVPPDLCAYLREIPDAERVGASFISHDVTDLARPRVAELKSKGLHVLCWTVRSAEVEAKARQIAENVTFEGYPAVISAA